MPHIEFMTYKPRKVIAVDVDGTLHFRGNPNEKLIEYLKLRKSEGFELILWSARGEAYARNAAELFDVTDLFSHIISKPGYIIDDKGWQWIKFVKVIKNIFERIPDEIEISEKDQD